MQERSPRTGGGCVNGATGNMYAIKLGTGGSTMMKSKHVHEWKPAGGYDDCEWACACGEELDGDDITRRLNATERLSEWMWLLDAGPTYEDVEGRLTSYEAAFDAYAAAVEGEDD